MNRHRLIDGSVAFPETSWLIGPGVSVPPVDSRTQAAPVRLPPLRGEPKYLKQAAAKVRAAVLADCSGSEYAIPSGDVGGFRFAVCRSLARLMRRTGGGQMLVVHWGTYPHHAGTFDVDREHRALDRLLATTPAPMGGNDFPAALRTARKLFGSKSDDHIDLVFGVTDGLEPITSAMTDAISALSDARVHVLLVPGEACPADLASQWQALPLASFDRLPMDNTAMAYRVGEIYAEAVGGQLSAPGTRRNR